MAQIVEVLIEAGAQHYPLFIVLSAELEVVLKSGDGEELAATHRRGRFTGELNLVSGRRGLAAVRVSKRFIPSVRVEEG